MLELKQARKAYGDLVVFARADVHVERGDRIALVGPNGSGKSTLMRMLSGEEAPDQGERVMGMLRLIGQVDEIVRESGDPTDFNAARWVAGWLNRPLPALGGRVPATLMDTAEGREIVAGLIAQTQSAAYA